MKTGIRYIVTKGSDDGTFQAGDHIWLLGDGSVACIEAQGWIPDQDVQQAMTGVAYEIDRAWAQRKLADAEKIKEACAWFIAHIRAIPVFNQLCPFDGIFLRVR